MQNYKEFVTNTLKINYGFPNKTTENGTLPIQKWKDVEPITPIKDYNLYNPDGGISIVVPDKYVVIDIDNHDGYDQNPRVLKWLNDKQIKTTAIQTRNGMHLWFKRGTMEATRKVAQTLRIGYTGDILSAGLIHIEKSLSEPFNVVYENGIGKLPKELKSIGKQSIGDNLKTGTARNDALRDFMNSVGLSTQSEIIEAIKDTRTYVINNGNQQPLSDKELFETVLRPDSVQYVLDNYLLNQLDDAGVESLFDEKGKILWEHVVNRLMRNPDIYVSTNGEQLYLFENGTYRMLKDIETVNSIDKTILESIGVFNTKVNIDKLLGALKMKLFVENRIVPLVANQPAVFNGYVVDWSDMSLSPAEREDGVMFDFGYSFKPSRNAVLEDALALIADNDKVKLQQIKELFAWVLMSDNLGKAVVLQGGAGTGKSTIVKLLMHLTGDKGVSNAEWSKLNSRPEMLAGLADKRLSINEDMQEDGLKDATMFKRLVTKEPLTAKFLYQNPFDFIFGGKLIATGNYTLTFKNGSEGVERRLFTLPINNRKIKHGDLSPLYEEIKDRPSNLRNGLLYIVTEVMGTLIERGEFLTSDEVDQAVKNTLLVSDPITAFLDWYSDTLDDTTLSYGVVPLTGTHNVYKEWASENGTKILSFNTFKQRLEQRGQVISRSHVDDDVLQQMVGSSKVKQFIQL
ncbi:DNA primase [Weissella phage PWc]|nr:DNA primase [Weissella phage PWc]